MCVKYFYIDNTYQLISNDFFNIILLKKLNLSIKFIKYFYIHIFRL